VPVLCDDFWEAPDTATVGEAQHRCEVEYRQRVKDGLRHAALKGLGLEKKPGLIRRSPLRDRGPF
jgi:hypothetical protein